MDNSGDNTILIAEDDEGSLNMLRTFLELEGYRVLVARNGEEAVEIACAAQPDLIMLDLNMPKLGGIGAFEQIRRVKSLKEVPILTNSSSGQYGIELFLNVEKLGSGYLEYIPKPFNLAHLAERIESALTKTKKAA